MNRRNALQVTDLTLAYGENAIFKNLNVTIPAGQITVLIGSNGCGKSTLLRAMARLLKPQSGFVALDGEDILKLPTKETAKKLAILPQGPTTPEGLTVHQLVKQGRYPYQSWMRQWTKEDEASVNAALQATGLSELAERAVDALSGGQRQRAWIAMTLAQQTPLLLLDEPTTYLDLAHQIEVLDLLCELNAREGRTIVMVLHDINLACRYADWLIAVRNGEVYAAGAPAALMTPALIEAVFRLPCDIITDPLYGTPLCVPHSKSKSAKSLGASSR